MALEVLATVQDVDAHVQALLAAVISTLHAGDIVLGVRSESESEEVPSSDGEQEQPAEEVNGFVYVNDTSADNHDSKGSIENGMEESRKAGVLRTVDSASAGLRYVFSLLMGNTQIDEFSGQEVEKLKFVNELRDDVLRNCKEAKFPPEVLTLTHHSRCDFRK